MGSTGGWQSWRTVPAAVAAATGRRTVFLTFRSGTSSDFVNLNWLSFSGGSTSTSPPAPTSAAIQGIGGMCVDAAGGSSADGTAIQLWDCNGLAPQSFSRGASSSLRVLGKCLDVTAASVSDGAKVQLYTCNGTGAQAWRTEASGAIVNTASGKCLDAEGGSSARGTRLQIWTCAASANQRWAFSA